MKITVNGHTCQAFVARIRPPGDGAPECGEADVKLLDSAGKEHWYQFPTDGLYEPRQDGSDPYVLYPAAEDLLAKWAVEAYIEEAQKAK